MSQAVRRLRRFGNVKSRQDFNARRRAGKQVFNSVRDVYARFGAIPENNPEIESKINEHVASEIQEFLAPHAFEKSLFLASDEPQAKKDRVDEFIPTPPQRHFMNVEDVMKAEVNDAKEQLRNTLFPTDWAKQKLALVKPEDPDYQYWQNILSGINEEDDKAYEADVQDLVDTIQDNYGEDEHVSSVAQELKSARNNSKQAFESKVREVKNVTDQAKRQVEQIAQQNIQNGGSKSLWESKIAQADYLARNDARLQEVFNKAMPQTLERKVNTKTFELFKLDKNFIEQYKDYTRLISQKQHEQQAAQEESETQFSAWLERFRAHRASSYKYIQQHNDYVDWWNSRQEDMTIDEFFHTHPKIWAWFEWRLAHYRIDFSKTDEQYAKELAHDYSYWPLPRNP